MTIYCKDILKRESDRMTMRNAFGDIVLFEIPIYSMGEGVFLSKWNQKIQRLNPRDEESYNTLRSFYRKQMLWHYNQIVGYITVDVCNYDITFNVYKPIDKKIRYDSPKKPYMENLLCGGTHFRIDKHDNAMLASEIKSWVSYLLKEYVKKPLYADTSLFDACIDCIDIIKLIELRKYQYGAVN